MDECREGWGVINNSFSSLVLKRIIWNKFFEGVWGYFSRGYLSEKGGGINLPCPIRSFTVKENHSDLSDGEILSYTQIDILLLLYKDMYYKKIKKIMLIYVSILYSLKKESLSKHKCKYMSALKL